MPADGSSELLRPEAVRNALCSQPNRTPFAAVATIIAAVLTPVFTTADTPGHDRRRADNRGSSYDGAAEHTPSANSTSTQHRDRNPAARDQLTT